MNIFVGIDPSFNSTGLCILFEENDQIIKNNFFIVKPNKLTKKEQKYQEELLDFDYILYDKVDLDPYKDNNHWHEYYKTINMIRIVDKIYDTILDNTLRSHTNIENINIVIEGVSYGSTIRTKSVFDLSGLNYMIRQRFIKNNDLYLSICPPSEIKKFASGNGNCKKEVMVDIFKTLYPELNLPKVDDISDAYFMAKYAKKIYIENK